jgi:D-cysteine desulfhydrase family pyridoxal phosphate-dependent enzyme
VEIDDFPRLELGFFPTPLHRLDRLSAALGAELWIKRDDLTGLGGGGNKVRKLEYLLADVLASGQTTVVTGGGYQSNFARQTAAACAKLGLRCVLGLRDGYLDNAEYTDGGNVFLDQLFGAEVRKYPGIGSKAAVRRAAAELAAEGVDAYVVPVGGSNAIGSLGYVRAARELLADGPFDAVVVAASSCGTAAGLAVGLAADGSRAELVGMCVDSDAAATGALIGRLAAQLHDLGLPSEPLHCRAPDHARGPGYGVPTPEMRRAVHLLAETEGIVLDPVYSGKAFAGLLTELRQGRLGGRVVFVHTGGLPSLFPYRSEL